MNQDKISQRGYDIAQAGLKNEHKVIAKFNNWQSDRDAREWLAIMNYNLEDISWVKAVKIEHYKADVQVQIGIKQQQAIAVENLQVKLVSNRSGFNQIDKRWVDRYHKLWNFPAPVCKNLKHFTGELAPKITHPRNPLRMFMDEFSASEQTELLSFFQEHKNLIVPDIFRGRGKFAAEWMLVIQKLKNNQTRWVLKPMTIVINHYAKGIVKFSSKGSIMLAKIIIQRKGGDRGRKSANMLQFKIDPTELFNLNS